MGSLCVSVAVFYFIDFWVASVARSRLKRDSRNAQGY